MKIKMFGLLKTTMMATAAVIASASMASCSSEDDVLASGNTRAVTQLVVSDNVTTNTTWSGEVLLTKKIAVTDNATLTIEPGTVIKGMATGNPDDATALIITKGAKIHAVGTANNPIVMTAENGQVGGWGGLILLGKAPVNQTKTVYIEGIKEGSLPGVDTSYGGNDPDDNSGILRYVRVEYAGATIGLDNELNSFTFGGVGRGTTIDHCQAYWGDDDGFEFFGGTVNAKYLVAVGTTDDSFDFDFGYNGTIQFAVSKVADARLTKDPNGIECDNEGTSPYLSTPYTHPVLSNFTIIGSENGTSLKSGANFRRNCQFTLVNSVLYGFPRGILKETSNSFVLESNVICAAPAGKGINFSTHKDEATTFVASSTNSGLSAYSNISLNEPWGSYKTDDLTPYDGPALSGTYTVAGNSYIEEVSYKGAFDPDKKPWTSEAWVR